MKRDRTVKSLFAVAALMLVLGLGNIIFGQVRLSHYQRGLTKAQDELAVATKAAEGSKQELFVPEVAPSALSAERQSRLIQSLKARIDFYSLVVLGGRCMLAFAGVSLLGILLHRGISSSDQLEE